MSLKEFADNDPGGDLNAAYLTMTAQTVPGTQERLLSDLSIANALGLSAAVAIMSGIQQAVTDGAMDARVVRWLETGGVDINHADTQASLTALAAGGYITTSQKDALIAIGYEPAYPGLTLSQLDKARRLRAEGKI